jgi:hypothetical protein
VQLQGSTGNWARAYHKHSADADCGDPNVGTFLAHMQLDQPHSVHPLVALIANHAMRTVEDVDEVNEGFSGIMNAKGPG